MNTINDLKTLLLKLFYSISFKYRIHMPFLITVLTIVYLFKNPNVKILRQTLGYNLLGLTYFVMVFSIFNLIFLKKSEIKGKIFYKIENLMFIFLCVITHIIYTKFTGYGMFGGDGHYNLIDGIYPFFKISIGFFIILYFMNRKKINSNSETNDLI